MVVLGLTAVLLTVAIFIGIKEAKAEANSAPLLSVQIPSESGEEWVNCWKSEKGEYYVFLPSYADLSKTKIHVKKHGTVYVENQQIKDGMTCENFRLNDHYTLRWGEEQTSITFMQSANIPAMYIDTRSGNMDYIHEDKENEEPGALRLYTSNGAANYHGELEKIHGRGNSTWLYGIKKPYNLELAVEADLLEMGSAKKWILLANESDPTHLRNKFIYDFAEKIGLPYSPESDWVDLYLNGEYAGLYLLSERNEVHPQRVNLSQMGSFLVSTDASGKMEERGKAFIRTKHLIPNIVLRIRYSAVPEINMKQIWQSAENAILAEDGIDPITGKNWLDLIDLDSWAKKYLVEEIATNIDGGVVSQFFYYDGKDETGRIYAGPVWDYDETAGFTWPWYMNPTPANVFCANRENAVWFHALYQKKEFYGQVVKRYTEYQPILADMLERNFLEYEAKVASSAKMNEVRWGAMNAQKASHTLQTYMTERMNFLSSIWTQNEPYCMVNVRIGASGEPTMKYAVRLGECLPDLPEMESTEDMTVLGWYTSGTDEPFDVTESIYEDADIYLKISYNEQENDSQD